MSEPACRNCGGRDWSSEPGSDEHGRCRACREFPTLGWLVGAWIETGCVIPDGDLAGEPYELTGEMWRFLLRHYRVDPFVEPDRRTGGWRLPFHYVRGSQLVRPQKWGKGPFASAIVCAEAAPDGPVLFDGWDASGQPVGRPWATPHIQVTAASEDQSDNVWGALLPMIERGSLQADIPDTGLTRINLPGGGKIEPVSSSALSRLGQRITLSVQDQTESWTQSNKLRALADTQRRGLAGMGGRWLATCNKWDPSQNSVAQFTSEHEHEGVWHDDVEPGPGSVRNKADRRRMLRKVYGDSWWVNIDRIDAEIEALLKRDPAQAERWYLNRALAGEGAAFDPEHVARGARPARVVERGSLVVVGCDGARYVDGLGLVATHVDSGHQFTLGVWERPPDAPDDYEHPFDEIDGALQECFERFYVWRVYVDPQYVEDFLAKWQGRWGPKRVMPWLMHRPRQTAWMIRRFTEAVGSHDWTHDGNPDLVRHFLNARKQQTAVRDDHGELMHTIAKDRQDSPLKIDGAAAAALSWEARLDAIAAGAQPPSNYSAVFL